MEYFKALGVEAKWQARLDQADDILRKLKRSAMASARLTYLTFGWGSRLSGPTQRMKQDVLDETDAVLVALGATPDDLANLKDDYLFFAALDLCNLFEAIVRRNISDNIASLNRQVRELESDANPRAAELRTTVQELQDANKHFDSFHELRTVPFRTHCLSGIPDALPNKDKVILEQFAERLSGLVEDCKRDGRVNDVAAALIDKHSQEARDNLYRELFGDSA
jgi:hypothetical protein